MPSPREFTKRPVRLTVVTFAVVAAAGLATAGDTLFVSQFAPIGQIVRYDLPVL